MKTEDLRELFRETYHQRILLYDYFYTLLHFRQIVRLAKVGLKAMVAYKLQGELWR